jgi:hypothetical protein
MAIYRTGFAGGTNTATLPTNEFSPLTGDLAIVFAFRDGSTTAPSLPTGWTSIRNDGANSCSARIGWRYLPSGATNVGTWTNATTTIVMIYRCNPEETISIGVNNTATGSSTTVSYPALTGMNTNNASWVVGFAGHVSTNTTLENAPTGMTSLINVQDATDEASGHDTNGEVGSWSAQNVSVGGTSGGWRSYTVELKLAKVTGITPQVVATAIPNLSIEAYQTLAQTLSTSAGTAVSFSRQTRATRSTIATGTPLRSVSPSKRNTVVSTANVSIKKALAVSRSVVSSVVPSVSSILTKYLTINALASATALPSRAISKGTQVTAVVVPSILKRSTRTIPTSASSIGNLSPQLIRIPLLLTLNAVAGTSASLYRTASKAVSTVVSTAPALRRLSTTVRNTSVSPSAALYRLSRLTVSASTSATSTISKGVRTALGTVTNLVLDLAFSLNLGSGRPMKVVLDDMAPVVDLEDSSSTVSLYEVKQ